MLLGAVWIEDVQVFFVFGGIHWVPTRILLGTASLTALQLLLLIHYILLHLTLPTKFLEEACLFISSLLSLIGLLFIEFILCDFEHFLQILETLFKDLSATAHRCILATSEHYITGRVLLWMVDSWLLLLEYAALRLLIETLRWWESVGLMGSRVLSGLWWRTFVLLLLLRLIHHSMAGCWWSCWCMVLSLLLSIGWTDLINCLLMWVILLMMRALTISSLPSC